MGQADVYGILSRHTDQWLSTKQIFEIMVSEGGTISRGSIMVNLSKLYAKGDLVRKKESDNRTYVYKIRGDDDV